MPSPFRHTIPSDVAAAKLEQLRRGFAELYNIVDEMTPQSREKSLAITNLEQAAMWANKAMTHNDPESKPE